MRPRPSGNASSIGPEVNDGLLQYFEQRGTALPSEIEVFTQPFIYAKQTQRAAFRNRLQQDHVPASFGGSDREGV